MARREQVEAAEEDAQREGGEAAALRYSNHPEQRRSSGVENAAAAAIFAAMAYGQMVRWPWTATWPRADAVVFLTDAQRMLRGEVLYRDFFQFTFPGTQLYYAALMRMGGETAWIPTLTMVALAAAAAWLSMQVAQRVTSAAGAWLAGLAVMAIAVFYAPDATHHWFSVVAALGATLLALRDSRSWRWAAGGLCGVAAFFTQSTGLLVAAAIAGWVAWSEGRAGLRRSGEILAWFAGVLSALLGWFVWRAGARVFWDSTVVFVLRNFGTVRWNSWQAYFAPVPAHRGWADVPGVVAFSVLHALLPLVYVLFLVSFAREREKRKLAAPLLIALVGLAMLAAIASAPSANRMAMASAPGFVLLAWMTEGPVPTKVTKNTRRVTKALLTAVVAMAVAGPMVRQREWKWMVRAPIGQVAVSSAEMAQALNWVGERTHPGEYAFGHLPLEYGLELRQVAPIPFTSGGEYTTAEQVRGTVAALEAKQVPLLLLTEAAYAASGPDHLQPFREYVETHYRVVKVIGPIEVWVRNGVELSR